MSWIVPAELTEACSQAMAKPIVYGEPVTIRHADPLNPRRPTLQDLFDLKASIDEMAREEPARG